MEKLLIINANELVTCSGSAAKFGVEAMNDLGVIENGAIAMEDGIITHVGTTEEVMSQINADEYGVIDAAGKAVTPGFVDSHTHFIFGGYRADEYDWRLRGLSYVEIMERGGGIINSVKGTEDASLEELVDLGLKRLDSMLSFGVTTVEGKSGYGLYKDTELKQLEALKICDERHELDVVKTFLGAHSVPKEYKGRGMDFIDYTIEEVLPVVAENKLAEFCDIFCEDKVFSVEESRKLLLKAQELGLKSKIHADEIVQLGGSELAAEIGATSADHLLQASDEGIKAMAEAGVVATCLPCTAFSLKEHYARARYMVDQGCAVAVATDFNPGSCHTESIPLAIALSTLYMGLTTEETITALTINGAAAVGRADTVGSLDVGKKADVIVHEFPSYKFLPYHIGVSTVELVIKNGQVAFVK
ncbi:imidazolonepropionase [Acidaminobacter sp. JC074]|uniref:imidazolonepropionase n=1 Tax=Acidaminobacter sp. JC074 TaxID=2530199 RepID=UPI001F0E7322|nr:imidazolonepropionase [Acidaminobacter sp. JC074]MCH4888688.1 imidazolonepropionase [Acidaminobacter sp. JC074]